MNDREDADRDDTRLAPTAMWPEQPMHGGSTQAPTVTGYEILEEIGRGGMGVVYRARQIGLDREVALKMILHSDYASEEHRSRFLRESQALARLRHENVVNVYEVGEVNGTPYFSLELVPGGSLDKYLDGSPKPNHDAARLIRTLAEAIHAAHESGIVHRDLKPANVLIVVPPGGADDKESKSASALSIGALIPKITDFGLAKNLNDSIQTRSGAVLCTPSYAAPEQAKGKQSDIGPTTDVYALGAILYELITGRPPFHADSTLDLLSLVIEEEAPVPRLLNPRVDRDLETICLKCLEKDQSKRYAGASELAEDLDRYLNNESIRARSYNLIDRLARTLERGHLDAKFVDWGNLMLLFAAVQLLTYVTQFILIRNDASQLWKQGAYGLMLFTLGVLFLRHRKGNVLPQNSSERQLWSIWISYFLATGALNVIGSSSFGDAWWNEGKSFAFHSVVAGLAFFGMGSQFWGGFYAFGIGFWCIGLLMLLQTRWGALIHGFSWTVALTSIGLRLRWMKEVAEQSGQGDER